MTTENTPAQWRSTFPEKTAILTKTEITDKRILKAVIFIRPDDNESSPGRFTIEYMERPQNQEGPETWEGSVDTFHNFAEALAKGDVLIKQAVAEDKAENDD